MTLIPLAATIAFATVVLLLVVHLLLGFRRLREVDYYRDDPIVLRLMGLRRLPDVATICRALGQIDAEGVEHVRQLAVDPDVWTA